jgi:hypothetical protein
MKKSMFALVVMCALAGVSATASAKGCLKGAAVGGVAGHVAGHHAVLGAVAGCAIGHHEAKVKDRKAAEDARRAQQAGTMPQSAPAAEPK